jgi:hypothetical protein
MSPRTRTLRQLRSLTVGEGLNIPLQAFIWFGMVGLPVSLANAAGYGVFALVLVEGTAYWVAKHAQVSKGRTGLPGVQWFRVARKANFFVLALVLGYTAIAAAMAPGKGTIPGLVFAIVAIGEHVNYFHMQLVRGRRRSHLSRDLDRIPSN